MLFFALDKQPVVTHRSLSSSAEFQRTLSSIEKYDPRNLQPGTTTSLALREEDLQLFLDYFLEETNIGAAEVDVTSGRIAAKGSVKVPVYFFERYLNLHITMFSTDQAVVIEGMKLGKLPVPDQIANVIFKYTHQKMREEIPEYRAILDAIINHEVGNNEVKISYRWQPELVELLANRGKDFFIDGDDTERLKVHALKLAEITNNPALPAKISLVELLMPMFEFAQLRGGDPVQENEAAIMVMAFYIMDIDIAKFLGSDVVPAQQPGHQITLSGRQDFAKHFLTSAAITISSSTSVADSFGITKEIEDSTGGSGFSFTDVGADRAGVRFAELAISDSQNAIFLQKKLSTNLSESIFIPDLKGLPEFMSEDEFLNKYGGVNQPEFQRVITDIEERISQLPLFNSL